MRGGADAPLCGIVAAPPCGRCESAGHRSATPESTIDRNLSDDQLHIALPSAAISRVSSTVEPSLRPDTGSASRRRRGRWAPSLLSAWLLLIALAVGVTARPSAARPWLLPGNAIASEVAGSHSGEAPLPQASEAAGRKLLDEAVPTFTGWFAKKWTRVFPQQWATYQSNLQRLRLGSDDDGHGGSSNGGGSGGEATSKEPRVLAPHVSALLSSSDLLNPAQMARSLAYMGGGHRLRRVLRDLAAGGAAGQDGRDGPQQPVKIAVLGGSISWGSAVTGGHDDWFTLVAARLREAFPRAKVVARNGCVPATPSSFMNMCLENYLDDDVDLVFLEYATNDGWDINNEPKKLTYERLLRKVLNKPRSPAVVLVQLPTVGQAFDDSNPKRGGFARTVEDVYGAFAAYYDTPYLSFRNAIWRLARHHQYTMNFTEYYGHNYDFIHPLVPGHRAIADMVLYALQRAALDLETSPWSEWDAAEASLPIPGPMFEGNVEERNRLCRNGEALSAAVAAHAGWELVDEGAGLKQKWGFVSHTPGAELVIELNTTRETRPEEPRMSVQLAYLKSYSGMGAAAVRCANGCECDESVVDAHHSLQQSTIYLLRLRPTQAARCQVRIKVLARSTSSGHKFKVTGLMANEYVGNGTDIVDARLNNEEWLGMINKAINATITNDKKWPAKQPGDAATGQSAAPAPAPSAAKTGAMVHHRPRHHLRGHDSKGPNTTAATGPQLPVATGVEAGVEAHRRQHQQGGAGGDDA